MHSGKGPAGGRERPSLNMGTVRRLLAYLGRHRGTMIAVVVCILLSSLAAVAASLFFQRLIDDYILPLVGAEYPELTGLIHALMLLALIFVVGVFTTWFYNWFMVSIAQNVLRRIRDEMFEKMQKLPVGYFDAHPHGDVMSRYTNDTDALRQMLANGLPNIIASLFTIVTVFGAMLYLSIYLTVTVLLAMAGIMLLVKKIAGHSGVYFFRQQETLGDLNAFVEEMVSGQKVIKVFSHEEAAKAEFHKKNEAWRETATRATAFGSVMMPLMNALGSMLYVVLALVGGLLAAFGVTNLTLVGFNAMSLGTIAAFLILSRNFTQPISQIASQFNAIIMAVAGATRIFSLMDEEPEADHGSVTLVSAREDDDGGISESPTPTGLWAWKQVREDGSVSYTRLRGDVVFDDVDFGYDPEKLVLHHINLYAKPGQKVAFVGATGAGKTTVTNLINRFYDLADGKIRYDGININKIKKADLRRSLGVVLQEVNLFTDTVMENIRYGNPHAADEDCIAAAKLAGAHNFIKMLPQGYQTVLTGAGAGLSQGQRQLLSIARAAVSDPPVMILDEATSSIDTRTEAQVQKGMDRLMEGRTVLVIAHRLSTVRNSDVIMVLDQGVIIERGDHRELLEKRGTYYQLYTGAFELE